MLSKAKIKYIRSLEQKKSRKEERAFLAEGAKLVGDLEGYFPCRILVGIPEWLAAHPHFRAQEVVSVTPEELAKASLQKTPQEVLAVFEMPDDEVDDDASCEDLCLALDDVQDPGNLGTIIRLADWFGIRHIYCSLHTVDVFNPKAVQATMGALARVRLHYVPLADWLCRLDGCVPVYGTFLDGEDIYGQELLARGVIVMGNEGNGISPEVERLVSHRLYIPSYPPGQMTSESLNVAMATAIVCAEFRRRL